MSAIIRHRWWILIAFLIVGFAGGIWAMEQNNAQDAHHFDQVTVATCQKFVLVDEYIAGLNRLLLTTRGENPRVVDLVELGRRAIADGEVCDLARIHVDYGARFPQEPAPAP